MYRDPFWHRQSGAGLPIALFIITVLSLLVFGMGQLQQDSSAAISLQVQSQRAFFAAESGAQVGVQQILAGADAGTGDAASCPALELTFDSPGLSSCSASVSCSATSGDGILRLTSIGRCGVLAESAERRIEVTLR